MTVTGLLWHNFKNAAWVIGGIASAHMLFQVMFIRPRIHAEVFGMDGNGGKMLKIITDLTDEEMSRLKHVRRLAWHWRGSRQNGYGRETISDQELSDRGIKVD